ncbi:hypothetical protein [Hymenobacter lapidiphilus]|uniref:Uncharacterized protein n=1 Tax=Hymenobacter lapidiphilus TaxID=2608003 RepID=A0A7Y7PR45_9BACT|nr:hypothetical protein [Hymenobacter lapidiphilus]NVO32375.1 hypothetical protein [Hymenobacter lapidiphilus]
MLVRSDNAAQLAVRLLNRPRLHEQLSRKISATKAKCHAADAELHVI